MDPLSISASIAGLVTLADVVFLRLMKYVRSAKNAVKEIEELAREINVLGGALNSLSRLARSFDDEPADNKKFRMHHIEACSDILTDIQKKLKKFDSNSLKKKAAWPFQSEHIKELRDDLARHKQSVDLALSANSMELLLRSLAREEDLQKTTSEILAAVEKTREITSRIHRDDERQKVLKFFLRYNPQQNYEMSLKLRHPRTGLWLLHLQKFQTWLSTVNEKLWLTGIPGAGKTVLAGIIIEAALARCDDHVAGAFFFCDYKDKTTHSPVSILGALAYQLAIQKEEAFMVLEQYFRDLHPSHGLPRAPTVGGLERVIGRMVKLFHHVFFIVDGIDECGELVDDVLQTLCSVSDDSDNMSMALLSRDEPEIRDYLEHDFVCEKVAAHTEDITEYATAEIEERIRVGKLRIDDLKLKGEIMQSLIDGASGMFRWVACQLDHLQDCVSDQDCREALRKLPPDLNETYLRILKRIPLNKTRLVQKILNFSAFLREVLSVPENGGFLEPSGLIRESSIQRLCSSLIRKSNNEEYFEFSHFSVQEFLQDESLLGDKFEHFLISETRCNRLMATQCLRYLQLGNFDHTPTSTMDELKYMDTRNENYPLYGYAAFYWVIHAKCEWADKEIIKGAKELFNPRKTDMFTSWSIELFRGSQYYLDVELVNIITKIMHNDFTPLHMACLLWLPEICSQLLEQGVSIDQKSRIGTPMQCATGGVIILCSTNERHIPGGKIISTARYGTETVRCLLNTKVSRPLFTSNSYETRRPLQLAMLLAQYSWDLSTVTLLLSEGVPLEESDIEDFSVLFKKIRRSWTSLLDHETFLSGFKLLLKALNSMINHSYLHRELCSRAWAVAVNESWAFASDLDFVDPSISLSRDMQRRYMICAVEDGNVTKFERIQNSSCLNPSDISDQNGQPLLHLAMKNCHRYDDPVEVIESLVTAGCTFCQHDSEGRLPIYSWSNKLKEKIYYEPFIKCLIDHGVRIEAQDSQGQNLLHLSTHDSECLSALLRCYHEADGALALRMVDYEGYTPLTKAMEEGQTESACLLFEKSRNDPQTWQSPIPALLLATRGGFEEIFRTLVSSGETLTETEGESLTPLHYVGPTTSIGFVDYLKFLYPGACNVRRNGKVPLDAYLERLFEKSPTEIGFIGDDSMDDESMDDESMDDEIIAALYPVGLQGHEGKLIWEYFVQNVVVKTRRCLSHWHVWSKICTKVIKKLMQLGCLTSYETITQTPAILSLLPDTNNNSFLDPVNLWPITRQIICDVANKPDRWPECRASPSIVRLLKEAVMSNDKELVALLLDQGVDVHKRVGDFSTLEVACRESVPEKTFRLLLDRAEKERLDEINLENGGLGLIHLLAVPGADDKIVGLRQCGADPNLRTGLSPYDSPLIHHLNKGEIKTAITLLEQGADPTIVNRQNFDACHVAALEGATDFLIRVYKMTTSLWRPSWQRLVSLNVSMGSRKQVIRGCNALHLASCSRSIDCLRFYMEHNIFSDVNTTTDKLLTPLHFAALHKFGDAIKFLHSRGANINARTVQGHLPLHFAVWNQNLGAVETLLKLGSEVTKDQTGMSPYLYARQRKSQAIIDCLRNKEDDVAYDINSIKDGIMDSQLEEQFRLAIALEDAIKARNIILCKELRQKGCQLDIDMPSCKGCSPLLLSIRQRRPNVLKWLLAHGASTLKPCCQRCGGWSPIHIMLKDRGSTIVLKEFLEKYLDDGGSLLGEMSNPVHTAVLNNNNAGLRVLLEHVRQNARHYTRSNVVGEHWTKALSIAINRIPNPDDEDPPLHVAVNNGNLDIVNYLLENGADINAVNKHSQTPLHIATSSDAKGIEKVIGTLINYGAELNFRDRHGWTPLMLAASKCRSNLVEALLSAGADPSVLSHRFENALSLSASYHCSEPSQIRTFVTLLTTGLDPRQIDGYGVSTIQYAMGEDLLASVILNSDYDVKKTGPLPWGMERFYDLSWLTTTFPMFRKKIPIDDLRRIANIEPNGCWSPLCISASRGVLTMMENLLILGANMEFEGCPEGTALMAACHAGRLESVIFLVRRGASLKYHGPNGFRTAFDKKTPKHILRWLLVTRFTDQGKIEESSSGSSSDRPVIQQPWSGTVKAELIICESLERRPQQSSKDYWAFLMDQKKRWRGKVVPVVDRRKTVRSSKLIPMEHVRIHPGGYEVPKPTDSSHIEAGSISIQGWRSPN
ncbi:ankyrin [Hypoxylon sp. EC38]|nr:ankyrin [Hypoxylon sp. EC38]